MGANLEFTRKAVEASAAYSRKRSPTAPRRTRSASMIDAKSVPDLQGYPVLELGKDENGRRGCNKQHEHQRTGDERRSYGEPLSEEARDQRGLEPNERKYGESGDRVGQERSQDLARHANTRGLPHGLERDWPLLGPIGRGHDS